MTDSGQPDTPRRRARRLPTYTDVDPAHWKDYPEIETGSLWLIRARDRSAGHRLDYHGNFVPQVATQTFLRYTRRGDVVLDLFLGSGTSAIEAVRLGRRCVGVELKAELLEHVRAKLPEGAFPSQVKLVAGDSAAPETCAAVRAALADLGQTHAHLLVLHPPYDDVIHFSDRPEDLSNAGNTESFLERFATVARHGFDLLEPGRFAVLVIGDKYAHGELVPLGFYCMQKMVEAGFRPKALIVKNIEGNEIGKGQRSNLWRYRALAGGFYIFKHEYVIVLRKPSEK